MTIRRPRSSVRSTPASARGGTGSADGTGASRRTSRLRSGSSVQAQRVKISSTAASRISSGPGRATTRTGSGEAEGHGESEGTMLGTGASTVKPELPCSVVPSTALTAVQRMT